VAVLQLLVAVEVRRSSIGRCGLSAMISRCRWTIHTTCAPLLGHDLGQREPHDEWQDDQLRGRGGHAADDVAWHRRRLQATTTRWPASPLLRGSQC
jgi:hypothetical protein